MSSVRQTILAVLAGVALCAPATPAGVRVVQPASSGRSGFAIIVDSVTYARTGSAVDAYRSAVEADGLPTYTVVADWHSPEEVRGVINDLRKRKPAIEGFVLIGDVPVVMMRDAQHLTTAFKMDQERPWAESSVPTDRYYDDPDLRCTFLKRDSANGLLYYYSLDAASPQRVDRDLYSARMLAPGKGDERFARLEAYLQKVVALKKEAPALDHALVFTGHGYHSEALSAWEGMLQAFREQFPQLYMPGGGVRQLYHAMTPDMKEILLRDLQDPALDMAIFHAHGADDVQYLLGDPPAPMISDHVNAIKTFLRSKLRQARRRKQSVEEAQQYYIKEYGIPDAWFDGAFVDSVKIADSLAALRLDLYIDDIRGITPAPRFVMFDECFNGNYTAPDYVAGAYLFGKGNTVTAVANSVNILQDIWADELLGLLGHGVRAGLWHQHRNTLESHLLGDPTFRYAPSSKGPDLNVAMVSGTRDERKWRGMLSNTDPTLRMVALRMLHRRRGAAMAGELRTMYARDPSYNVRLEILRLLAEMGETSIEPLLPATIRDPYELIRRMSVKWMGAIAKPEFVQPLVRAMLTDPSERVVFNAKGELEVMAPHAAAREAAAMLDSLPGPAQRGIFVQTLQSSFRSRPEWLKELSETALADTHTVKKRVGALRSLRVYPFPEAEDLLIRLSTDSRTDPAVRVAALEAMGWYTMSHGRDRLIKTCERILGQDTPDRVRQEAEKTRKRLLTGPNNVLSL